MKFKFNTGRLYAKDGQPINVEISDGRVWFYDEARGIAGSFEQGTLSGEREIKEALMYVYDRCMTRNERIPKMGEARSR